MNKKNRKTCYISDKERTNESYLNLDSLVGIKFFTYVIITKEPIRVDILKVIKGLLDKKSNYVNMNRKLTFQEVK